MHFHHRMIFYKNTHFFLFLEKFNIDIRRLGAEIETNILSPILDDQKYSPLKRVKNRLKSAKVNGFIHKWRKNRLISRKLMQNEIFHIYSLTAINLHIKKNFLLGVAIW